MNLYRDGVYVETYQESREVDVLSRYLTSRALHTSVSGTTITPSVEPTLEDELQQFLGFQSDVENGLNPSGAVLALDEANFENIINKGKVFVKFFAPW